ncbi:MAG: helicase-related protein [Acholeplasma sp.]|jgi:replicative superfamily II helicase|nr:helicase-related protein [Acholeplasma sp.]
MAKSTLMDIYNGKNLHEITMRCIKSLFNEGPKNDGVLETLSSIKYHNEKFFENYEDEVNLLMGLFYKDSKSISLRSQILAINKEIVNNKMLKNFTPIQVEMIEKINNNKVFSFSTGTSVGKSFVFRELLTLNSNDVIVVVPSRALINEYMLLLESSLNIKEINLLQHVDFVNRKNARRNIFILTPERAKDVFYKKELFNLDLILFDEAQLANEKSNRGLLFDGIVRRFYKEFPNAKIMFAHPFISNPNAQIVRNNLNYDNTESKVYLHKNVGQIYISYDKDGFYQFAVDKENLGNEKIRLDFDPIERVLTSGRSILIYMPKAKIIRKEYIQDLYKYRKYFNIVKSKEGMEIIKDVQEILGVSAFKDSFLLRLMKLGIVLHHGSMPLDLRRKIEKYINKGHSKICIATSTLYQGINMPFDLVWVDRLESSKPLGIKNLIGRAGRATQSGGFDFGVVLVKDQSKSEFRKLMSHQEFIEEKSNIDTDFGTNEIDVIELKEAIRNNDFSDKYSLTNNEVNLLSAEELDHIIVKILDTLFNNNNLISYELFRDFDTSKKQYIKSLFMTIYIKHLRRKKFSNGEKDVLFEGLQILLWTILGKSFKQIAALRFFFTTKFFDDGVKEIWKKISLSYGEEKNAYIKELSKIKANYLVGYNDIPDIKLAQFPKFKDISILDVDYDTVIFDTYDFMDKLISLRLKDVFYATFDKYFYKTKDVRAETLSNLIKYGTNQPKRMWLQRYGFLNDEIDVIYDYVKEIDENEIVFDQDIYKANLKMNILKRYL